MEHGERKKGKESDIASIILKAVKNWGGVSGREF
jgi:hypothetical protein